MASAYAVAVHDLLVHLGVPEGAFTGGDITVHSPIDGGTIGAVHATPLAAVAPLIERAHQAHLAWRQIPGPRRGELVRLFGEELRAHKADLGRLVTLENGKILSEGLGEVQEMIDICDFAVGLSRQLHGLTIASERPGHAMRETWHPLGVVGVISAFNFPVAVWAWNSALALVCGDAVVWKPSEITPLTALACGALLAKAAQRFGGDYPADLSVLLIGASALGEALVDHPRVPLISATGSTRMGRLVAPKVAARLGRTILELGGNNAGIVCPSADLDLAVRAIAFAAVGTAGQRCTTLRRVIVHESIAADLIGRLAAAYASIRVGNPLEAGTLVGPLIHRAAQEAMETALARAKADGGIIHGGERVTLAGSEGGFYVRPALVEMPAQTAVVAEETFAPILYAVTYRTLDEAIALQNAVPQGLSSSIFTNDLREAETFLSAAGSDCGIANVNIGPSGAEIGGAFGGEKDTGGGRESGSDAWKGYMRRATNTVNYSGALPLAQGVSFEL
ncbi:aldehyde dehydrogenase family protein [Rhodospirillum rubrum]|uniref:L-piperidine-6-carboxylate dehydrogenase n=1 Tax=Rhodospirillum rubrum TaxID=1085 RepID=UPI001903334E|nr:aldehyde dehydrogenase family protein [Rhodospirillum rubrum]MBK1665666.1 aldehyde dehydrogenase family protein [Rhodospirillum rubrum]MBK1677741.1 aldehyde dehydrogenase family protein [Rhodospirillum rubrum]